MKLTKNQKKQNEVLGNKGPFDIKEALEKILSATTAKFDETIEVHIKLGVDGTKAEEQVRGTVVLPEGTGKTVRVLAIAKGDKADEAKAAGADIVGAEDVVAKIAGNWLDFDVCVTTPDMMPVLGRVARVLGPKGLMPNPKSGTVAVDIAKAIKDVKAGKVEYRLDKGNVVHTIIGKKSFGAEKLANNFEALMSAIVKAKPAASKGTYLKSIAVCSTMSPALKIKYVM